MFATRFARSVALRGLPVQPIAHVGLPSLQYHPADASR
jgi:hypothetical protein